MSEKLNVCLLNDSFPPTIDGVANAVFNYASIIQQKFGNSYVVTPEYPGVTDNYPFRVYRYPSSGITRMFGYRAGLPYSQSVYSSIAGDNLTVIHSHCPAVSNMVARTIREITGTPMIFTYHTKFDIEIRKAIRLSLIQEAAIKGMVENMEAADEVWTVSEGAGKNLRSLGFRGNYRIMQNGVDLPCGRVTDEKIKALKSHYNIPDGIPVFLFVGRVTWYKGLKITLDALRALQSSGQDFRMVIVGNGLDLKDIKNYASRIGIGSKCIFAGPVYDRQLLRVYFCFADLFLFPSTYDTNGIVVHEAAACGLASVLVRGSCAAEDITDGKNGLLIDETPESMAILLFRICKDMKKLHEIGMCAMDDLYISWEDSVRNACTRYETIIEKTRGRDLRRSFTPQDDMWRAAANMYKQTQKIRHLRGPHKFIIKKF